MTLEFEGDVSDVRLRRDSLEGALNGALDVASDVASDVV